MTMVRSIPAGEFKARCLAVLDRVDRTGETVVVTKRGRPVAKVVPVESPGAGTLKGSVTFHADVVGPILDDWEVDQ